MQRDHAGTKMTAPRTQRTSRRQPHPDSGGVNSSRAGGICILYLPNRGFTCKEISMQEAEEIYDLRQALEAFAVEKAIEYLTDTAVGELRDRMNRYGRDVDQRFSRDRLVFDQDVHLAIARLCSHIQAGKNNVVADLKQRQAIRALRPIGVIN